MKVWGKSFGREGAGTGSSRGHGGLFSPSGAGGGGGANTSHSHRHRPLAPSPLRSQVTVGRAAPQHPPTPTGQQHPRGLLTRRQSWTQMRARGGSGDGSGGEPTVGSVLSARTSSDRSRGASTSTGNSPTGSTRSWVSLSPVDSPPKLLPTTAAASSSSTTTSSSSTSPPLRRRASDPAAVTAARKASEARAARYARTGRRQSDDPPRISAMPPPRRPPANAFRRQSSGRLGGSGGGMQALHRIAGDLGSMAVAHERPRPGRRLHMASLRVNTAAAPGEGDVSFAKPKVQGVGGAGRSAQQQQQAQQAQQQTAVLSFRNRYRPLSLDYDALLHEETPYSLALSATPRGADHRYYGSNERMLHHFTARSKATRSTALNFSQEQMDSINTQELQEILQRAPSNRTDKGTVTPARGAVLSCHVILTQHYVFTCVHTHRVGSLVGVRG